MTTETHTKLMPAKSHSTPGKTDTPEARYGFLYFLTGAIAIAIICLGVVVFSGRLPG